MSQTWPSSNQLARLMREWSSYAKEEITVEKIHDTYYGYGSELACLRLYYRYRYTQVGKIKVEYSKNLKTWFFRLET